MTAQKIRKNKIRKKARLPDGWLARGVEWTMILSSLLWGIEASAVKKNNRSTSHPPISRLGISPSAQLTASRHLASVVPADPIGSAQVPSRPGLFSKLDQRFRAQESVFLGNNLSPTFKDES